MGTAGRAIAAKFLKGKQAPWLQNARALLTGEPVGDWHLMIGNPFGYGGWGSIDDTANFNIRFYDSSKTLIKEVFMVRPYREINIPNGAKYVMLDLNDSKVGNGNTDFGNSISFLLEGTKGCLSMYLSKSFTFISLKLKLII